jgi:Zn-dependent metalloprotease
MKEFTMLLIFCIMFIFLQNLLKSSKEGLENCDSATNNTSYKNNAKIQQQQKEMNNFKDVIKSKISALKAQISSWNVTIKTNSKKITNNTNKIKKTVQSVQKAKKQKEKELNDAGGGL